MNSKLKDLNVPSYYGFASLYFFKDGIGRRQLAEELGLTESQARTMKGHLRERGFVESSTKTWLSEKGKEAFQEELSRIKSVKEVGLEELVVGEYSIAARVSNMDVRSPTKVRDQAVRAGAGGLTVLKFEGGLTFPRGDIPEDYTYSEEFESLEEGFDLEEDDSLFISSGRTLEDAKAGLWAALEFVFRG